MHSRATDRRARGALRLLAGAIAALFLAQPRAADLQLADLADLSLEQLANIEVTSVTGRPERLSDAPASIYVITNDDIRRSGVRTLPEALRLAPNLQVARTNASTYGISARGFNNAVGNKLLVLIDGRTVYTPLFSGVFWDQQDVMLEDIERIEVISGPGATLWGTNAVNGVINVITRQAKDTQGGLVSFGGGNRDGAAGVRHGGKIGADGHYRIYARGHVVNNTERTNGTRAPDGWQLGQAGFRADWRNAGTGFTLQGDVYNGKSEHGGFVGPFELAPITVMGANLLGRWTRQLAGGSDFRVQAYIDHTDRVDPLFFEPKGNIYDIEFRHGIPLGAHRVLWGGGYRHGSDEVKPGSVFTEFIPDSRRLAWANVFAQDEIKLTETLEFTVGIKFERNDYTGWEALPNVRLAWKPADNHLFWSAISRAVRAPSRLDRDVFNPALGPPFVVLGGPNFESEVANVFEIGYRGQPTSTLSYSATVFRHDWDKLRSGQTANPAAFPPGFALPGAIVLANDIEGTVDGVEAWASIWPSKNWKLTGGFTYLGETLRTKPGGTDTLGGNNATLANDPDFWWTLRSTHNLGATQEFDLMLRHVDELRLLNVPAYTTLNARWGLKASRSLEVSLTLENILEHEHIEFGTPPQSVFGRSVFLNFRWQTP